MDLSQRIAEYGAEAVNYYVKMARLKYDNEVREEFVSARIAIALFERDGLAAHVERDYLRIVQELGNEVSSKDISSMGSKRADIAIYNCDGNPLAVIEVKICDEGDRNGAAVLSDYEKIQNLRERVTIDTYLAILLTDINDTKRCEIRRGNLEESLHSPFTGDSGLIRSQDAAWEWQFLAGKF
ncbi:hypothetical protein HKD28_14035 [Gluconobacter sp. LMG 1744]|uniref:hypothetical protein n=1 Tax=Gluconobacter TaxID=441 RepID=UPI001884FA1B|nr:hypothetical protein [Gluconobacter cadivus]MBF0892519.1 hypothetical protein [Gluconobacter cadivus]